MKAKDGFVRLPYSELEIMHIIWELDHEGVQEICASAILRRSPELNRLQLTTVITLIHRLERKGFIDIRKEGRVNCYRPLIDAETYHRCAAQDFLKNVYQNDTSGLISALLGGDRLPEREIAALRRKLRTADEAKDK